MSLTLLLLMLFPLIWPFIAKAIWGREITIIEIGLNIGIVLILVSVLWWSGTHSKTSDTEIWNGQVTSKNRVEDSHRESYSCNCRTVTHRRRDGSTYSDRKCQTCYRTRYTVDWTVNSTIGKVASWSENSLSRSVWSRPDPGRYTAVVVGEPCSKTSSYTNYIKGVPDSLFRKLNSSQYESAIPPYPKVYDLYRVRRVLNVGSGLPQSTLDELNFGTSAMLRTVGAAKQVNVTYIVTNITDRSYRHAVETKWLGGKKNDVVIFLGVEGDKIVWADAMTFALNKGNELFQITMRDGLQDIGRVDVPKILQFVEQTIVSKFDRTEMKQFQYLENDIEPPTWLIILNLILSIIASVGLSIYFSRNVQRCHVNHLG